jgi:hypothetical protein
VISGGRQPAEVFIPRGWATKDNKPKTAEKPELYTGVEGWLLFFCVCLTVFAPLFYALRFVFIVVETIAETFRIGRTGTRALNRRC